MQLIKLILNNYKSKNKGMPLGNLTSQFFANVYLNELDQFVKHKLKAKYYIRYVDDFVIINSNKELLKHYKIEIDTFLKERLDLELHPNKSKIINLSQGINFLGFRVFYHHKLLRKSNIRKMKRKLINYKINKEKIKYDKIYDSFAGWQAYAKQGNTYNLRKHFANKFENQFPGEIADAEIRRWIK